MGNSDSQPQRPSNVNPRSVAYNDRNNVNRQQVHNVSSVQGQGMSQTRPASVIQGQGMSYSSSGVVQPTLNRTQETSQANMNAQRIQTSQLNQMRPTTVVNSSNSEVVQHDSSRLVNLAPPIPLPRTQRNLATTILEAPSTSSTHVKLPEPLVPVKNHGSISKPHPTKPPTYLEINLNLNTALPMLKASIKDVKDPKFLQFHKELNKTKPLSDIRLSLINNQHLSDVKLIVNDKTEVIYGHKMFLITASSLFLTHFEHNNEVELIIENVETGILLELLKYCYTNQVNITEQNVLDLLKAANYLKVRQLSNVCHSFISNLFNENSIFVIFQKALQQKNELFEKKCIAFMLLNEEKCFSSKEFYKIGFASLLDIVGRCKFSNEKNEEIIKKWNYGAENMVFASSETKPDPLQSAKPKAKKQNKPAKASTSTAAPLIPSLFDLHLNDPQTSDFVYHDDDNESIQSKDDDKTKVFIKGNNKRGVSEFSRLDLSCKKSILLHEIGFTADLSKCGENIKVSISLFEGNQRKDVHLRTIKNDKRGMRINFIKFARNPLKFYIGQKLFIKLNFVGPVSLSHVAGDKFSHPDIFETRKDVDKNYLNCISYIIVSDMPRI